MKQLCDFLLVVSMVGYLSIAVAEESQERARDWKCRQVGHVKRCTFLLNVEDAETARSPFDSQLSIPESPETARENMYGQRCIVLSYKEECRDDCRQVNGKKECRNLCQTVIDKKKCRGITPRSLSENTEIENGLNEFEKSTLDLNEIARYATMDQRCTIVNGKKKCWRTRPPRRSRSENVEVEKGFDEFERSIPEIYETARDNTFGQRCRIVNHKEVCYESCRTVKGKKKCGQRCRIYNGVRECRPITPRSLTENAEVEKGFDEIEKSLPESQELARGSCSVIGGKVMCPAEENFEEEARGCRMVNGKKDCRGRCSVMGGKVMCPLQENFGNDRVVRVCRMVNGKKDCKGRCSVIGGKVMCVVEERFENDEVARGCRMVKGKKDCRYRRSPSENAEFERGFDDFEKFLTVSEDEEARDNNTPDA